MTYQSNSNWEFLEEVDNKIKESYLPQYQFLASLLYSRGIKPEDMEEFESPKLEQIPGFTNLYDSQKAAREIIEALKDGKKIFIHGDFDSDGVCATSILWDFLYRDAAQMLKIDAPAVNPYIPSRVDEGYGLSESSIDNMIEDGAQLIITVDCGIRDKELIRKYQKEKDVRFIITDHHQPPTDIEEDLDYTIVHQMFPGHEYPELHICGATVAFLLTRAIESEITGKATLDENTKGLDLVALATVTDMMPLKGVNRIFVKYGLDQMRTNPRLGLLKLCTAAQVTNTSIESYQLGYVIGPRVNASGRIGDPMDAVRMFLTSDSKKAQELAYKLNNLNFERQKITEQVMESAKSQIDDKKANMLNFVSGENWPEGIIGLVAGKIQESSGRPTLVVTTNNGETRGSARSLAGFNITDAIGEFSDLLEKYGGHEQAAGFTIKEGKVDEFKKSIEDYANSKLTEDDLKKTVKIDMNINPGDISVKMIETLDVLKPFGYGNSKPVIYMDSCVITDKFIMGATKNHMKLTVKGEGLGNASVLMFNCLEDIDILNNDDVIDIIGSVNLNEWNGNIDAQFIVKEWRKSEIKD
jgi:single-stranded-DNA-specific exonuclease